MPEQYFPYKLRISPEYWDKFIAILESKIFKKVHNNCKTRTMLKYVDRRSFNLMKRLSNPINPHEMSYEALVFIVGDYLDQTPMGRTTRLQKMFVNIVQQNNQSVGAYAKHLEKVALQSRVGGSEILDVMKKQLVNGLKNEKIQFTIFSLVPYMSYTEVKSSALFLEEVAKKMEAEAAAHGAQVIIASPEEISYLNMM